MGERDQSRKKDGEGRKREKEEQPWEKEIKAKSVERELEENWARGTRRR